MKEIHLIRHAKSSWDLPLPDHKRPLAQRGIMDAMNVGKSLNEKQLNVEAVYCSPSERTRQTADIILNETALKRLPFHYVDDLYDFHGNGLLSVIKSLPDVYNSVMVFGHNHAITWFVNNYTSHYFDNVPTCGYLNISFPISSWNELQKGVLLNHLFPKDLR